MRTHYKFRQIQAHYKICQIQAHYKFRQIQAHYKIRQMGVYYYLFHYAPFGPAAGIKVTPARLRYTALIIPLDS